MEIANRDFYKEFQFITSRSGGAGGQNVNKVSSKVELRFDLDNSELLNHDEKVLLKDKLSNMITRDGILQIVSQEDRSQLGNKEICIKKFYALLSKGLTRPKKRKPSRPTRSSVLERLGSKKKASEKKASRRKGGFDM